MTFTRIFSITAILSVLFLAGCASTGKSSYSAPKGPVSSAAQSQYKSALATMKRRDYTSALKKFFQTLSVKYPKFAGPKANMAIIYSRKGQYKKAEAAFMEAISLNAANPGIYNELGVFYRRTGKFEKSAEAYKKALSIDSEFAFAHLNLGILYDIYMRRNDKALKHYNRYQELVKNDKLVHKWIVDLKLRMKRNENVAQR